ncbi:HAD-IA family hydrolase [Paralcaligenes ureilyticus]|uniref:phosphoglycolate phosphatase n=1 Tax=Paralcaligenes ureilyticus TaxID=627131 RepID=A0A4R3M574_9BURK|nr:HAD-IA family hydrolase [Paralcaligenes ureilyticus]TCT08491.1 phosphoglycolate phosphatase [Paralcaligenes ureilyticus]
MKRYAAVVFDWDGTVMDSTHTIVAAIQASCADLGLPVPTAADASWVIGLSLEGALYHAIPSLTPEKMPLFLQRYRIHFLSRDPDLKLFDGVASLFVALKAHGVRLAVATGKSRAGLDRALNSLNLRDQFDATRCADESFSKPHPGMLLELMHELDLAPEQLVMVGDTVHDVQMASNAGVDSMAVTYGAHDKQTLVAAAPTVLVSSVREMRTWLIDRV